MSGFSCVYVHEFLLLAFLLYVYTYCTISKSITFIIISYSINRPSLSSHMERLTDCQKYRRSALLR